MAVIFRSAVEAAETNSACSFCRRPKFKVEVLGPDLYTLIRAMGDPTYCQWNHQSEVIFRPAVEHDDTMMIVRGG